MNTDPPGWHRQLRTIVALIAMIFAVGGWVYVQDWRVEALEKAIRNHSGLPIHPEASERVVAMETHLSYIRNDMSAVKRALERLTEKLDREHQERNKDK